MSGEENAAALLSLLWATLVDALGLAATATLLGRALKRVATKGGGGALPVIERRGLVYHYTAPPTWQQEDPNAMATLRQITQEIQPLLRELTGQVVLRRLAQVEALRRHGLFAPENQA